eukprot:11189356-Lingulodinium_polyedra.AAC.2
MVAPPLPATCVSWWPVWRGTTAGAACAALDGARPHCRRRALAGLSQGPSCSSPPARRPPH